MAVDKQEDVLVYLEDAYSFLMDPAIGIAIKEIKRVRQQKVELVNALHRISLGSQNSMTSKEGLGVEARRAIAKVTGE